jgi:DNA-directed RNA polymerase subunit beta
MLYSARIIPFKGSWIEFATDINNVMYAYIDRKKKLPVTTLLRAIGYEQDKDILQIFDLAEEVKVNKKNMKAAIGRKLAARVLKSWNEDFVDEDTGEVVSIERNEVIMERETELTADNIEEIVESGAQTVLLHKDEEAANKFTIIFNTLAKDPSNSEKEAVNYIYRQLRNADPADDASAREVFQNLFFSDKRYDLGEVGRYRINKKLNLDTDIDIRVLTKEDIIEIIKYLIQLINSSATVDDIDHLSNRRVRTVGEQLANQFSIGLARMTRTIRERMNVRDNEVFTPTDLINAKTISSVINSFFGTNPLSQFMDQTNPLAEVTHKRRLSALGPGGLSRERAGFEYVGPVYLRFGRLAVPVINDNPEYKFEIGKGVELRKGKDITIFATGLCVSETLKAAETLAENGIDAQVINIHTIKPLDEELVLKAAKQTGRVYTVEEHSIIGGLGSAVAELLGEKCPTKITRIGVKDVFGESGPAKELLHKYELDAEGIAKRIMEEQKSC